MEDLLSVLKRYFIVVEKLSLMWEGLAKKASKHLSALEIMSDQLQATSSIGHDDIRINRQFPGLEEQIVFKTFMSLEQELIPIIDIVQEVSASTEKLNQLASLIDCQREAQNETHSTVSVCKLLETVFDCKQYYQSQYLGLQISLKFLDFRNPHSVKDLQKSFSEDTELKKHIQRCILLGKHFVLDIDNSEMLSASIQ